MFRVKGKFDAIFVQQLSPATMALPGLWVKSRQGIPLVLWVLDLWPESIVASSNIKNNFIIKPIEKLVKWIYNKSDLILVSSKFFTQSVLEKCKNKNMKVEHFPNWAEDVFIKTSKSSIIDYKIPELPVGFNVMFAGNIGEAQDFEAILIAAELTKNEGVNWLFIGDGRKLDWVKNEVISRKIANIYIFGRHPMESMPLFFEKADAMLVSLKDEPIFSLTVPAKIQAYMASGKIILGMLNGEGNVLINESKCGFAVPAGSSKGLAEIVNKLKNFNSEKIKEMESNAVSYYYRFFSKNMLLSKLEKILIEIVENSNKK
jgi:glycosyltransferase involved in cell wall biosynthesis